MCQASVVEAEWFEDETVHGADDVTQDIPDVPEVVELIAQVVKILVEK